MAEKILSVYTLESTRNMDKRYRVEYARAHQKDPVWHVSDTFRLKITAMAYAKRMASFGSLAYRVVDTRAQEER